jgi:hypothetical protein
MTCLSCNFHHNHAVIGVYSALKPEYALELLALLLHSNEGSGPDMLSQDSCPSPPFVQSIRKLNSSGMPRAPIDLCSKLNAPNRGTNTAVFGFSISIQILNHAMAVTVQNSRHSRLKCCSITSLPSSEGSCPTLQARRSKKRRVLRYPSSGPVSCPQRLPFTNSNSKNLS